MTTWPWRRGTLIDLTERALRDDPGDAPVVYLEADLFADDLARLTPTGTEPARRQTL